MIKYLYKLNTKSNYDALDNAEHIYLPGVSYLTETGEVIFDNWGIKNQCLRQEIQQLSGITELSKRRARALTNDIFYSMTTDLSNRIYLYDGITINENGIGSDSNDYSDVINQWAEINEPIMDGNGNWINKSPYGDLVSIFLFNFGALMSEKEGNDITINQSGRTPITDINEIKEIDTIIWGSDPTNDVYAYGNDLVKALRFNSTDINVIGADTYFNIYDSLGGDIENIDISRVPKIKTRYAKDAQDNIYLQFSAVATLETLSSYTLQCPDCMEMKKLTGLSNFENCVYDMDGTPVFGDTITLETVTNPFATSQTMEKLAIPEQINRMGTGTLENTPELEEVHLLGIKQYEPIAFGWSGHDSLTQVHFYQPTDPVTINVPFIFGDATEWADNPINTKVIEDLMAGTYTPTDGQSQEPDEPDAPIKMSKGELASDSANPTPVADDITTQSIEEQILNAIGGIKFIFHCKLKTADDLFSDNSSEFGGGGYVEPGRGNTDAQSTSDIPMDLIIYQFLCIADTDYSLYGYSGGGKDDDEIEGGLRGGSKGANEPHYLLENVLFILQDSDAQKLVAALSDKNSQLYCPALAQRILPYSILKNQASNSDKIDPGDLGGGVIVAPTNPGVGALA